MPYRSLVFPVYWMTNASNFKCEFARNTKIKVVRKGVKELIFIYGNRTKAKTGVIKHLIVFQEY